MNPDAGQPKYSFKRISNVSKNIRLLFIQQFFEGLVPIQALYAVMFGRVGGLSFEQIGYLFAIWSLSFLVAELPSGVLADYWSRKKVILLGGILRGIGFLAWLLYPGFIGYAVGFALWGFTIACSSGAVTAYLHNELAFEEKEKHFAKYLGRIKSVYWAGALVGFIISAILTLNHTNLLLVISVISSFFYPTILLIASEHSYKKQDTYLHTLRAAFREVRQSKKLQYICFVMFSIYMIIGVLEELFPRLYAQFGLSDTTISLIAASSMLAVVLLLTKLEKFVHFSYSKQIIVMCIGLVLLVLGVGIGKSHAAVLILLFSLIFQLFRPVFEHHIQDVAIGSERATIGSVPGLFGGILGAVAYVVIGRISVVSSERISIMIYALLWLIILIATAIAGSKYRYSAARK